MTSPSPLVAVAARASALCIAGAVIGLAVGAARPGGLNLSAGSQGSTCEAPAVEPTVMTPAEAAKVCARDRVLIADARPAAQFAAGHIAGAVHLPCDAGGDAAATALAHLADRGLVLVYGEDTAGALSVARSISQRLPKGAGPTIYVLEGGFGAWEKAGLACASGPCDSCAVNVSAAEAR